MIAVPATAQIMYGQPTSGNTRLIYSQWSLEDDSSTIDVSQLMIPVGGFVPMRDNLELRFFAANASTTTKSGDTEYKLSGLSDMRLQLNSSFSDDRLLLSAGINLPTGKKNLSQEDERQVMALLTQNYISFPIRRLGEGFGFNLLAGAAASSGNSRLGGTIVYQYNGSYEAYEGEGDYTPGSMLSISASADTRNDKWALIGDIVYTTFGTDKLEGWKVFKQSDQVELHAGGLYGAETYGIECDLHYLIRGRNERYDDREAIDYRLKVYGNELSLAARFSYHPDETWYVTPLTELRFIAGNEFEDEYRLGNARNIGFGLEFGRQLGAKFNAGIGFKYLTGSADGGNIDLSGYRLLVSLQAAI